MEGFYLEPVILKLLEKSKEIYEGKDTEKCQLNAKLKQEKNKI